MEPMRPSFAHHPFRRPFRWPSHARLDICSRGERAMGFTPENRFDAGATRGFYWFQRQAGLAIQPMFGLGFRLRWSGSAVERLSIFGYGLAARARVLSVLARVLPACVHEFRGIGADWGVWEASSARFRHSRCDMIVTFPVASGTIITVSCHHQRQGGKLAAANYSDVVGASEYLNSHDALLGKSPRYGCH